jgi:hypothetical protein
VTLVTSGYLGMDFGGSCLELFVYATPALSVNRPIWGLNHDLGIVVKFTKTELLLF